MKHTPILILVIIQGCLCSLPEMGAKATDDLLFLDEFEDLDGEQLSKTHCIGCHSYPVPDLLPKESWSYVLDLMGLYFGYDDGRIFTPELADDARTDLFDTKKYPGEPTLGPFQWAAIRDFYESAGGSGIIPPPPVGRELSNFEATWVYGAAEIPVTSLVKVAADGQGFFLGDGEAYDLRKYDFKGRIVESGQLQGAMVQLEIESEIERATVIGRMHPSNSALGSIFERRSGEKDWRTLLEGLHRPVHVVFQDFDNDGAEDILVNQFGHYEGGSLALYARNASGVSGKQVLRQEPGAIFAGLYESEGKSDLPHILALNAQGREEITFYRNRGNFVFEPKVLIQKPPTFGYTQLHLVDVTGDGIDELVTVNGDNADLPGPPLKAYHGIRIYRIHPGPELEELVFLPMPGAFQATFNDFDGNGLMDIAVVSFFPDSRRPEQGFVLFMNEGELVFDRGTIKEGSFAPWMTIDSGDIDGDGDIDIVLGSAYVPAPAISKPGERLPAAMILRNKVVESF